ncbi:MAG: ribosome silencing factor [Legionellales bacterium]|nr:ribosome silencing factor [Legionellales bacterium]
MSKLFPQLPFLVQALEEIQANEIVVMDVSAQTTITDYMIVCGGRASRHVKAIADTIIVKMKSIGLAPLNHSGLETGDWALVDFGDCIVHIMQPDSRSFYCLEELWG